MSGIRRVCGALAVVVCLGLLTGCWDRVEIDDLAMIMGSGFDLTEDGQLEATVQIASPTGIPSVGGGGGNKKPVLAISEKGEFTADIMNRLQQQLSREFFLGHRGIVVIGERYARQGVDQVLSQLMRSPDSRYSSYVLTTYKTTAKEILTAPYELEYIPAFAIKKMQKDGNTLSIRLDEFLDALSTEGKAVITGAISTVDSTAGKIFKIDKAAVYQENKLVGFLTEEETKVLLWTKGELVGSLMSAKVKPETKLLKGSVGVRFLNASSNTRTTIRNGSPHVTMTLKARVDVLANDTRLNMAKVKDQQFVERKFSEHTSKIVKAMLRRSQRDLKVDIFNFGDAVHVQHPEYWKKNKKRWKEIYPEVPVTVKVDFTIERTGRTQEAAHLKK